MLRWLPGYCSGGGQDGPETIAGSLRASALRRSGAGGLPLLFARSTTGRDVRRNSTRGSLFSLAPRLRGEGWGEGLLSERAVVVRPVPPHPDRKRDIAEALLRRSSRTAAKAAYASPRKRGEVTREPTQRREHHHSAADR